MYILAYISITHTYVYIYIYIYGLFPKFQMWPSSHGGPFVRGTIIAETSENLSSDLNNSIADRARSFFSRSTVSQHVHVEFAPLQPFERLLFYRATVSWNMHVDFAPLRPFETLFFCRATVSWIQRTQTRGPWAQCTKKCRRMLPTSSDEKVS